MRNNSIKLAEDVYMKLAQLCDKEFRSVDDQLRYMIAQCYGIKVMPKQREQKKGIGGQSLRLKDSTSISYRVMVAAAKCYQSGIPINRNSVSAKIFGNNVNKQKIGNCLSNLAYNGFLRRKGHYLPAEYEITEDGLQRIHDNAELMRALNVTDKDEPCTREMNYGTTERPVTRPDNHR